MPAADYRLLTDATGQRIAAALEGMSVDRAAKTDLTSIIATGTTNTTGATITAGTYFYLNGTLAQALTNIASGATFTLDTNYKYVAEGGLNEIKYINDSGSGYCRMPDGTMIAYGTTDTITANHNANSNTVIAFGVTFSAPPSVTCNEVGQVTPRTELTGPNLYDISTTGFTARMRNDYSSNLPYNLTWIAIGRWK